MKSNLKIDQVEKFNYLGAEISEHRDLSKEVKTQVTKGARIAECLYGLVWKNKYMSAKSKVRIYKTCVRPVLTYAAKTRASTITTHKLLRTTEMRIIKAINGKTLRDRIRSNDLRELSGIQDILEWIDVRKRGWGEYVERMTDDRLAKIVKENRPRSTRSRGRPKKDGKMSQKETNVFILFFSYWKNRRKPIEKMKKKKI